MKSVRRRLAQLARSSTPQARRTDNAVLVFRQRTAAECSSVAYSWLRSVASRQRPVQTLFQIATTASTPVRPLPALKQVLFLFDRALQRMLMLAAQDPWFDSLSSRRLRTCRPRKHRHRFWWTCSMIRVASSWLLLKKRFQHVNDEFHRRVVVVQHQHLVERRLLGARLRPDDNAGLTVFAVTIPVTHFGSLIPGRSIPSRSRLLPAPGFNAAAGQRSGTLR